MKQLYHLFLLFLLLTACSSGEKRVYFLFDHSEGIGENNPVLLNGVRVGSVHDVTITKDYKVLVTAILSDSVNFPKDTRFEIQHQDFFKKGIYVTLGASKELIKNGDTIQGIRTIDVGKQNDSPKRLNEIKEMLRDVNL